MNPADLASKAVTQFQVLARQQFGDVVDTLNELSDPEGSDVSLTATSCVCTVLAQPPSPPDTPHTWAANAVRIGLESLADQLHDRDIPASALSEAQKHRLETRLRMWQSHHRAACELTGQERAAWLLFEYLALSRESCGQILKISAGDAEQLLRSAGPAIKEVRDRDQRLLEELRRINFDVWPPHHGILPPPMVALVRDAARIRVAPEATGHRLQGFYLAFGRLYRFLRKRVCETIIRADLSHTHTRPLLLNLRSPAEQERNRLIRTEAARRDLRRAGTFVRGQEPFADDCFALTRDAGLDPTAVGELVRASASVVEDTVEGYGAAIAAWSVAP